MASKSTPGAWCGDPGAGERSRPTGRSSARSPAPVAGMASTARPPQASGDQGDCRVLRPKLGAVRESATAFPRDIHTSAHRRLTPPAPPL